MSMEVFLENKNLDKLIKAFKKMPEGRIGILGKSGKNSRDDETGSSNAAIGMSHEMGVSDMPIRSFLRIPLAEHMGEYLSDAGLADDQVVNRVIKEGNLIPWMEKVMITAEVVVQDGFASGGFGRWKPSLMAHKKVQQTLVETQQLRNSITSEVVE